MAIHAQRMFDVSNYMARYFEGEPEYETRQENFATKIKTQSQDYVLDMLDAANSAIDQAISGQSPYPANAPNPFPRNGRDRGALR